MVTVFNWIINLYVCGTYKSAKGLILWKTHIFSGLYIYKLVLHEPTNSQNGENKQFLHSLCSPPTGNMALLHAVQNLLLSLRNITPVW